MWQSWDLRTVSTRMLNLRRLLHRVVCLLSVQRVLGEKKRPLTEVRATGFFPLRLDKHAWLVKKCSISRADCCAFVSFPICAVICFLEGLPSKGLNLLEDQAFKSEYNLCTESCSERKGVIPPAKAIKCRDNITLQRERWLSVECFL